MRALRKNAEAKELALPNYLQRWINIKKVFPTSGDGDTAAKDFTTPRTVNTAKAAVKGNQEMLDHCGLKRTDSDSDDIVQITQKLREKGFKFTQCMIIEEEYVPSKTADYSYFTDLDDKPKDSAHEE